MKLMLLVIAVLFGNALCQFDSDASIRFKGAGWFKAGRIQQSTDTITGSGGAKYTGNWMQDAGALFNSVIGFSEVLEGSFGVGVVLNHKPQGSLENAKFVSMNTNTFVNMARLTYTMGGDPATTPFQINTGLFSYKYDNNIKNLGLYLIRGPVYPGLLISGFESKEMLPSANMLGVHVRSNFGSYTQDVLLISETDLFPRYDYSLLYVGTYKPSPWLDIGAGINFYHVLPVRPGLTTPSEEDGFRADEETNYGGSPHLYDLKYVFIDTLTNDTTWGTHKGTKLMGRFALDFKPLLGLDAGGFLHKGDLKLYGEAAVIGLKDYPIAYDNISERIPVMFGFNIPTGFLNVLALEVEYYGSKNVPDLAKLVPVGPHPGGSYVPQTPYQYRSASGEPYDVDKDNIKWSLYGAKIVAGHFKFSGQIACDHLRTGGFGKVGSNEEALTRTDDWYWMLKTTFFF